MRISGLNSGMETEQIIKDLMTAQRIPVDRVFQQKVQIEWKRDAYRDVNTKLSSLSNFAFDLRLQNTFQKSTATSSHEDILKVTSKGAAATGTYELNVEKLASSARYMGEIANFSESEKIRPTEIKMQGLDGKMVTIKVDDTDTVEDIATKINAKKDLGISAFAHNGKISFTTKATGEDAKIIVDENFQKLFGADGDEVEIGEGEEPRFELDTGTNAQVKINGLDTSQASNTFDINGLTVDLFEAKEDTTVRVEVKHDVDGVVDKIKEFVNMYNELVDELNVSTREEVFREFPPLTDAQRAELSEKEIEQWEAKAKSGLLRADSIVTGILSEMRMALGSVVQGEDGNSTLAQIGITTGSWYEYGRLNIDEGKLRATIEEDPDKVMNLFTKRSENDEGSNTGIAFKLSTALDNGMKRLTDTAGRASISYDQSFFGDRIREYESRLSIMEERLIRYEESQWAKFTAMERVLGQLYAQGDWLSQQIMSMQG